MGIRVGIDTGGTFTDLVAVDTEAGCWSLSKVPSSPAEPVKAVAAVLEAADFDPAEVDFVVIGTTIGINAVLTRSGSRVLFLTTQGFEDIPFIQRISRKNHYDFSWEKPTPLVHRPDCIGVAERLDEEGKAVVELTDAELDRVATVIEATDGDGFALAVCYLFSYLNPDHELATRERLSRRFPDVSISLSHEVAPIWREYERGTSAIVDAYLKPLFENYVDSLSEAFDQVGVVAPWSLLKSNGGHAIAKEAHARSSHLLLSGIAGGAIGGAVYARETERPQAIMLDMGGTSCDVCLIVDGEPLYSSDYEIEYGLPVSVPSVSTKTIGAGGGSIGWIDPGGFLQVGPQSAGADPGPACYGHGGEEATLTDADVHLGRIDPAFFLGGQLPLDAELSQRALARLGPELGLDETEVASAMVRVANENMANAIRILTVEQGIDPRDFTLIALGGAGPTHGAEIAGSMGIERVLVPPNPGLCSAFGALAARVRVDAVRSVHLVAGRVQAAAVQALFAELERGALEDFAAQNVSAETPELRRSIAMRYQGQNYEQEVPTASGAFTDAALAAVVDEYHRLHEEFYGYRFESIPVEFVRLAVVVSGGEISLPPEEPATGDSRGTDTRDVYFPDEGFLPTAVVRRGGLAALDKRVGPLIVDSMDSTVVVPPGWMLTTDTGGVLELERDKEQR